MLLLRLLFQFLLFRLLLFFIIIFYSASLTVTVVPLLPPHPSAVAVEPPEAVLAVSDARASASSFSAALLAVEASRFPAVSAVAVAAACAVSGPLALTASDAAVPTGSVASVITVSVDLLLFSATAVTTAFPDVVPCIFITAAFPAVFASVSIFVRCYFCFSPLLYLLLLFLPFPTAVPAAVTLALPSAFLLLFSEFPLHCCSSSCLTFCGCCWNDPCA